MTSSVRLALSSPEMGGNVADLGIIILYCISNRLLWYCQKVRTFPSSSLDSNFIDLFSFCWTPKSNFLKPSTKAGLKLPSTLYEARYSYRMHFKKFWANASWSSVRFYSGSFTMITMVINWSIDTSPSWSPLACKNIDSSLFPSYLRGCLGCGRRCRRMVQTSILKFMHQIRPTPRCGAI